MKKSTWRQNPFGNRKWISRQNQLSYLHIHLYPIDEALSMSGSYLMAR